MQVSTGDRLPASSLPRHLALTCAMPKSSLQATSTQGSVSPAAVLTASIMRLAALKLSALEESNRKAATSHLHRTSGEGHARGGAWSTQGSEGQKRQHCCCQVVTATRPD